jgi:hypothetical protein
MNKYPEYIMKSLRQRNDLEPLDTSLDEEIYLMSNNEAMDEVLNWKGLIGYGSMIRGLIRDIYGIDLNDEQ